MLTIRLQRAGKRNHPEFRIVLAEKESSAEKKVTEILGSYNPRTKDFKIKQDRLQYWIAQHVSLSPTAHNLFVTQKLIDTTKVKAFSIPAKPTEPVVEPPKAEAAAVATPEQADEPTTPEEEAPVSEETVALEPPAPAEEPAAEIPETPAPPAENTPAT